MECSRCLLKDWPGLLLIAAIVLVNVTHATQFGPIPVTVKDDVYSYTRNFGADPSGTDGWDADLDATTPPPGMLFYSYFLIGEIPFFLSTDIKSSTADSLSWLLKVANATDVTYTIEWDPTILPATTDSFLLKYNDTKVDMRDTNQVKNTGNNEYNIVYKRIPVSFTYSISGDVRSYSSNNPVENAILVLAGDTHDTVLTDADGYYLFSAVSGGLNYTLTPNKISTQKESAISSYDAALVAQYRVGLQTFTSLQQIAGDVSDNGKISSYDAALILQYAVNIIEHFPAGDWTFIPESINYESLDSDKINQDFVAILYGDVSGNWDGGFTSNLLSSVIPNIVNAKSTKFNNEETLENETEVIVPDVMGSPGDTITVPIHIKNANNFISADLVFTYDTEVLMPINVEETSLTRDYLIFHNVTSDTGQKAGQMEIAIAGISGINEDGTLLTITFVVAHDALNESHLKIKYIELNEGNIYCSVISGVFSLSTGIDADFRKIPDGFALLGNYPNPFNTFTVISYSIVPCHTACIGEQTQDLADGPYRPAVSLRIFDLSGRLVRTLVDELQKPGHYKVNWDGRDNPGREVVSGIYLCRLDTGNYTDTKKMVVLK